ncbi:hypothetical protein PG995_010194 [Apiospora arundinis]|uniref:MOSC domain-containing protein n=1 Tax=Apiospora arundinis TaxID=335852 RepID=A0ABR2IU79_9PEZI
MKVTQIYAYPIKALRPMPLDTARLTKQGLEHDRRFMLLKVREDGSFQNVQIIYFPECARLFQAIDGDDIVVTHRPAETATQNQGPDPKLRVPLRPDTAGLGTVDIQLFGADTRAYRMGAEPYDRWFSTCLGYEVILVYIGDGRRRILAHSPRQEAEAEAERERANTNTAPTTTTTTTSSSSFSWLSSITSYVTGRPQKPTESEEDDDDWLTFNEAAPYLVASQASLHDVSSRLPPGETVDMMRFRPNIVVDGDEVTCWEEDYWGELLVSPRSSDSGGGGDDDGSKQEIDDSSDSNSNSSRNRTCRLALTANCGRCNSINIDYETGRMAEGEAGTVLKKLMRDRRVDAGDKWSPIFGRYAHLLPAQQRDAVRTTTVDHQDTSIGAVISVGDEVKVTRRNAERTVWRWPKT